MRLSITPIGATGRTPTAVANAVVAYLDTAGADPGAGLLTESAVGYYADSVEGLGLWLGAGAVSLGLIGVVNPEHLRVVLEGRDPRTGERLITAQGSAQRAHQATISPTSPTDGGDDELSTREAARLLGVSPRYMRSLITDGRIPTMDGRTSHLTVRRSDVVAFAATRVPPVARVGYDVTLTCEKSMAIGMLLSTGPTRQAFIDAFDRANRAAIDYLDRHAAVARRQGRVKRFV